MDERRERDERDRVHKVHPRGESGRASRSFPQEYPTNSIEVACAPSTNRVSLYLNACGNKRHVRIGTRTRARQVSLFTFLPPVVAPFLRFPSSSSHPPLPPRGEFTWHVGQCLFVELRTRFDNRFWRLSFPKSRKREKLSKFVLTAFIQNSKEQHDDELYFFATEC